MFTAYKKFWTNYVNFTGRSSRSDYWWAALCNSLIMLPFIVTGVSIFYSNLLEYIVNFMTSAFTDETNSALSVYSVDFIIIFIIVLLFVLATILPNLAISVRRLRDAGFHWSLIFVPVGTVLFSFLSFVPFLRAIVSILVWFAMIFYYILLCQPTKAYQAPSQPLTAQQPVTPQAAAPVQSAVAPQETQQTQAQPASSPQQATPVQPVAPQEAQQTKAQPASSPQPAASTQPTEPQQAPSQD